MQRGWKLVISNMYTASVVKRKKIVKADVCATTLFYAILFLIISIGLGNDLWQAICLQFGAIPVYAINGFLYGLFRDWAWRQLKAGGRSDFFKAITDVLLLVFFQPIFYTAWYTLMVLLRNKAHWLGVVIVWVFLFILSAFTGWVYIPFLDWCRRLFGTNVANIPIKSTKMEVR